MFAQLEFEIAWLYGLGSLAAAVIAGPSPLAHRLRAVALRTAGSLADEAVGESLTVRWVAANKPTLCTITVILALLLLLSSSHETMQLLVRLAVGMVIVLGVLEILSRPASSRRRKTR